MNKITFRRTYRNFSKEEFTFDKDDKYYIFKSTTQNYTARYELECIVEETEDEWFVYGPWEEIVGLVHTVNPAINMAIISVVMDEITSLKDLNPGWNLISIKGYNKNPSGDLIPSLAVKYYAYNTQIKGY